MASRQYSSQRTNGLSYRSQLMNTISTSESSSTTGYGQTTESESNDENTSITVVDDPSTMTHNTPLHLRSINVHDLLRAVAETYEISKKMAERLLVLQNFEIVIVCDDSGSMQTLVDGTQRSRWDELCSIVKIVLKIGTIFDSNGADLYFLNRRSFLRVKDPIEVDQAFADPPRGYTQIVPILEEIFLSTLADRGRDKKLLVFVATDGLPTDEDGNEIVPELERIMRETRRADTTYVSFLLCTDEEACVDCFNEWDRTMVNVDVTDNFNIEREKIRRCRGADYRFSCGDYVVKALIGAVDRQMDALDEP